MNTGSLLGPLRSALESYLEFRSIDRYKSRLPSDQARIYSDYLEECRRAYRGAPAASPDLLRAAGDFASKGFASFWAPENRSVAESILAELRQEEFAGRALWDADSRYSGDIYRRFPRLEEIFKGTLGAFLETVYGAYFKIFYGVLYKSERSAEARQGSQIWHYDGGPGTCINVMFYLKDVAVEDGAIECLPWKSALRIYRREMKRVAEWNAQARLAQRNVDKQELRAFKTGLLSEAADGEFAGDVEQPIGPAGLVVAFRNNSLHRGGFPDAGRSRYVCVFHCYPSDRPTALERYRTSGIAKRASYPADPSEDF